MSRHSLTILLFFSAFGLAFFIGPKIAQAVGPINYLPFKGTIKMSCGYHLNCGNPPNLNGEGIDWQMGKGKVTYASGRGAVNVADEVDFYGNNVTMYHSDLYWSRYAHLWYWFPAVNHILAPGMPVGYTGNTGCAPACGNHLHWHIYRQNSNVPDGNDPGVDPAPIPNPYVAAEGFSYTLPDDQRNFTNNTNYDNNVYGCDETYSCFTFDGPSHNQCQWINGDAWNQYDIAEGYFWQGANDGARVYQVHCPTVSGSIPSVWGIFRPSNTNNPTNPYIIPVGTYRVYAFLPEHPSLDETTTNPII